MAAMSKRNHKSPNTRIGKGKKPPARSASTTKNSHSSPRRIALRRKMNEALSCRERGLTYTAIAKQFRVSVSVVHGWVVQAMHALPIENAKLVLQMELKRLDGYLAAYHDKALLGDESATKMCLRILYHRARLLGLYPEHGTLAQVLIQAGIGETPPTVAIEFVTPTGAKIDMSGSSGSSVPDVLAPLGQRLLPPPTPHVDTPFGRVPWDDPPAQPPGPRTELDLPRRSYSGGESKVFGGRSAKGTDWMGS